MALTLIFAAQVAWALSSGSLSGTLTNPSGAVIPAAKLTLTNTALKSEFHATSDAEGFYSFPALPVGHYDLTMEAAGFQSQRKTGIAIDADASVRLNAVLQLAAQSEAITVTDAGASVSTQVEMTATHLGEVVASAQIEALVDIRWRRSMCSIMRSSTARKRSAEKSMMPISEES